MGDDFNYDVFLSHNSKDKPRARKLAKKLRDAGLRVWFDEWTIQPGDDIYRDMQAVWKVRDGLFPPERGKTR